MEALVLSTTFPVNLNANMSLSVLICSRGKNVLLKIVIFSPMRTAGAATDFREMKLCTGQDAKKKNRVVVRKHDEVYLWTTTYLACEHKPR